LALRLIIAFAILFRLTFWTLYPALSDDVFRYRWEGKLQAAGGNPYEVRPNDPQWKSLQDETFTSVPGRDFRAVYGPLVEGIEFGGIPPDRSSPAAPLREGIWFKAPAALFDLGVMAALWLLLRSRVSRRRDPDLRLVAAAADRVLGNRTTTTRSQSFHRAGSGSRRSRGPQLTFTLLDRRLASLTPGRRRQALAHFLFPLFLAAAGWRRWRDCLVAPPIVALAALPTGPPPSTGRQSTKISAL